MSTNMIGGTLPVRLTNVGMDPIIIENITVNNEAFSFSANFPITIDGERNNTLNLRFNYETYDGAGNVIMTFYVADEEPSEVEIRTPFKRILLNLSDHASNNYGVDFSSDGVDVLYYSDRNGSYDIFLVDAIGSNRRQITNDQYNNVPVGFNSNNSKILFYSNRSGYNEVYTIAISGGEIEKLTNTDVPAYPVAFSQNDGMLLYYTQPNNSTRDAWLMNFQTGQNIRLNKENNNNDYTRFWPIKFVESDTRVLMQGMAGTTAKMFLSTTSGENLFNVIDDEWSYIPVDYSETRLRILAYSTRNLRRNIYAISPQGNIVDQITNSNRLDFPVDLSPNNNLVLFYSDRDGSIDVYVINYEGSAVDRITANPYDDRPVKFAPNNNTILFNSDRNTYSNSRYTQVYMTNFN